MGTNGTALNPLLKAVWDKYPWLIQKRQRPSNRNPTNINRKNNNPVLDLLICQNLFYLSDIEKKFNELLIRLCYLNLLI